MPIKIQATNSRTGSELSASRDNPKAKARLPNGKTRRPPRRSIALPILGPTKPETRSEMVKAQKRVSVGMPRSLEIGTARIAGR